MRGRKVYGALVLAAAIGGLGACGTHHENGNTAGPPPTSAAPAGKTVTVALHRSFAKPQVRLDVGQRLVIDIAKDVNARPTVNGQPKDCIQQPNSPTSVLVQQCTAKGLTFVAQKPGVQTLVANVRPSCPSGEVCPDWIAVPRLKVIVDKATK